MINFIPNFIAKARIKFLQLLPANQDFYPSNEDLDLPDVRIKKKKRRPDELPDIIKRGPVNKSVITLKNT